MKYFKTDISDSTVLILDEKENAIALDLSDDTARILYADPDKELITAAGEYAGNMGKSQIVADFCFTGAGIKEALKECGYEFISGSSILAVNIKELFSSKAVQKSISISFPEVSWVPFRDLLLYQLEELVDEFAREKIPLKREDIGRFDEDLSGIVYDSNGRIKAFVLVSEAGADLLFECMYGASGNEPKYIMAALQGFAKEMISCDLLDIYDRIVILEINSKVTPLIKRLLDSNYELERLGNINSGKKNLSGTFIVPEFESGKSARIARELLLNKLGERYYQSNINWKVSWKL